MSLKDIPVVYREAVCMHENFRKLGFSPEQIFFVVGKNAEKYPDERDWGYIMLKHSGGEFTVTIAPIEGNPDEEWAKARELWNSSKDGEALEVYINSASRRAAVDLITALLTKGVSLPFNKN